MSEDYSADFAEARRLLISHRLAAFKSTVAEMSSRLGQNTRSPEDAARAIAEAYAAYVKATTIQLGAQDA